MTRSRIGILAAALVVAACGGSDAAPPDSGAMDDVPLNAPATPPPPAPTSLADISPDDTASVLALIRRVMQEGDSVARGLVPRDTALPLDPPLMPRELSLWTVGDQPLKLVASEPNTTDRIFPETRVWFRGGALAVYADEVRVLLFDADRIVMNTDAGMMPVPMSREATMALEREVVDTVAARLAVYGVGYP